MHAQLKSRARLRYQALPIHDDQGEVLVGVHIQCRAGGVVSTAAVVDDGIAASVQSHYLHYCSHSPPAVKKSVVLGIVARIDRYTSLPAEKPEVLQSFLNHLHDLHLKCGYPWRLLAVWARACKQRGHDWIRLGACRKSHGVVMSMR